MAESVPKLVPGRSVGPLRIRAWLATGRRADVWWAEGEDGPIALRMPRAEVDRGDFDDAQRRFYLATGRRGTLRPEGAVESLIRGDALTHLIAGAESNGPVDDDDLAALAQGVIDGLVECHGGHGDLVPNHVLIGEGGLVRLIDADPESFREARSRPGRSAWIVATASTVVESDLASLAAMLTHVWTGARLPDETPAPWVAQLARCESMTEASAVVPWGQDAQARRVRLLARLCPERRRAFAELAGGGDGADAALAKEPLLIEPADSAAATHVDVHAMDRFQALGIPDVLNPPVQPWAAPAPDAIPAPDADAPPSVSPAMPSEPPSLGLPKQALVPTEVVRERRSGVQIAAAPRIETLAPPPTPKPRTPTPIDAQELVTPVPEEELHADRFQRRLGWILALIVVGLAGVVAYLVLLRMGYTLDFFLPDFAI